MVLRLKQLGWCVAVAAFGMMIPAWGENCHVAVPHEPSGAEKAYLAADYEKAAALFRAELTAHPNDAELTERLARVLLRQQKVKEADEAVSAALAAKPESKTAQSILLTAQAEVRYRQGMLWEIVPLLTKAQAADICVARMHLMASEIQRRQSNYLSAKNELETAHGLDPQDEDILGQWIGTLPLRERIAAMEKYLAAATGDDAEDKGHEQLYLDHLKKRLDEPHEACRLVSQVNSTEMPFEMHMYDASHIRSFGLGVKINQRPVSLEIDTGASGLTISKSVADRAGLKRFSTSGVYGIGDTKDKRDDSYTAYADTIKVGNLEFRDCMVDVVDNHRMRDLDTDGLIGMDIFSKFLVTLNYPGRKLSLSPLPLRPGDAGTVPTLNTDSTEDEDDTADGAPDSGKENQENAAAGVGAKTKAGPFNRYIAPEMKDYTPIYRLGHDLLMPVSLNKSKRRLFTLDTGAWAISVSPDAAREVTKVHSDYSTEVHGLSGEVKKMYSADEITFFFGRTQQTIQNVPCFDVSALSKDEGVEISGFLGAQTLQLLTIHIDYRDGLVKFDYDPTKTVLEQKLAE